jgi:hypothetical protein
MVHQRENKGGGVMKKLGAIALLVTGLVLWPYAAQAHCDTLNGPVVAAAREALARGDITPVLMWIKPDNEAEVREVFTKALAVRGKGPEAQELADKYFFETLVRIHRAGEGAPYTGLKAEKVEPPVAAADKALETGAVDELVKMVTEKVAHGIRDRFNDTLTRKKHANESVKAGREFVESYVPFTHYVEGIYVAAEGAHGHEAHGSGHGK